MNNKLNINEHFDKPSTQEWLDKINKDLKGAKTVEELQYIIDEGLVLPAVQAYSPTDNAIVQRQQADPIVAIQLDTKSGEKLTPWLELGANMLILDSYADTDWAEVLDGVILDYINILIYPMESGAYAYAERYFRDAGADMNRIHNLDGRQLIHVPYTLDLTEQLVDMCTRWLLKDSHKSIIILDAQEDFLAEIAKLRAARILMANLEKATSQEIDLSILSHTHAHDDKVHELIQSSYMSLSAIIGQADGVVASPRDRKYLSNHIHISNLLTMESRIDKVIDPSAGSNLIESMTDELVKSAWTRLQERV